MPELPEVERVRRTLAPTLVGARVLRVSRLRRDVVTGDDSTVALLTGARITELRRKGKQLALCAEGGRWAVVQLGMTGQLVAVPRGRRAPRTDHVHIRWRVRTSGGDEATLLFRDARRFGGVTTLRADRVPLDAFWADLGPDALTIRARSLADALARTRRAVKAALLDQRLLAGVGNIYADEALFRARVRPLAPANALPFDRASALASDIRRTLREAIDAGGSTLRDYVDGTGRPGTMQRQHKVYGRAGQACVACGEPLTGAVVAQRTTVWCERCQQC